MSAFNCSKRYQRGQAVVLFALLIATVLLPMVGLAIDGSRMYNVKAKLSTAVDGAAIAAARLLASGSDATAQTNNAVATAKQFVAANFPTPYYGASLQAGQPSVCVDLGDGSDPCNLGNTNITSYKKRTVVVTANASVPLLFMRIVGFNTGQVKAVGVSSRRDVRVVLAIDRSSSMSTVIGDVVSQAQYFVGKFSPQRDELGLVVFGGSAIVAYPPRDPTKDPTLLSSFKPADKNFSPTVGNLIGQITSGSNTGTAEALYLSYMTLKADAATNPDLSSKLNVIVLFTDGLPNGLTVWANNPANNVASGSTCTQKAPVNNNATIMGTKAMTGWLSQTSGFANTTPGALGLKTPMMITQHSGIVGNDATKWMQDANGDNTIIANMTSCASLANGNKLSYDLPSFPKQDIYGNRTDFGAGPAQPLLNPQPYKSGSMYSTYGPADQNLNSVNNAYQVGIASWNATADQAWKIWNNKIYDPVSKTIVNDPNPINPVIFTIGYFHGGESPDQVLMKVIANTVDSPLVVTNRINGNYYYTTTSSQVSGAFAAIASEILRLAQ